MDKVIGITYFGDIDGSRGIKLISVEQCAYAISHSAGTRELCARIMAEPDEETQKAMKKGLRCLIFHAVMEGKRLAANAAALTGLVCLDYDEEGTDFEALRAALAEDPVLNPALVFRSPRGKVKCAVRFPDIEGYAGDDMAERFAARYKAAAGYIYNVYGVKCDTSCLDLARNCFMSFDPEPVCNPSGECRVPLTEAASKEYDAVWEKMKPKRPGAAKYNGAFTAETAERYGKDLETYRNMLTLGDDGDWVYDREAVISDIGSVSKSTTKYDVGGLEGYQLKWRVSDVACWLYGDKKTAQMWLETHFPEARNHATWTPICDANMRTPPKLAVLRWVLRAMRFKLKTNTMNTKITFKR